MAGNKNTYLERRQAANQAFLDAGEQMGMQKMWDYIQIALRDSDTMGKDVFGRQRMEKIFQKTRELADYFHEAFTDDKEADLRQEQMDAALWEIWGKDLYPFYERYPQLKKIDYTKPKKNWRE